MLRKEIRMEKKTQIVRAALAALKIEKLNPMQEAALACAAGEREDVILLSPTGTGKTLAYLLPLLQLLKPADDGIQAMILVSPLS